MNLEFVRRDCPLCDGSDYAVFAESNIDERKLTASAFASRKLPEYMHFRMVECKSCGMLYANPAPRQEILGEAYKEASFDAQAESRAAAKTYRAFLEGYGQSASLGKSVLDIGAGDGAFVEQLLAMGFDDVVGVEPSHAPLEAARPEIRARLEPGIFVATDFAPDSLDLITCCQVMEHIPNPLGISRDAFSLLRPGGHFFIVVHNRSALSAKLLGEKSPIFDIEHLQLFDEQTGEKLLEKAGFRSICVRALKNRYPIDYGSSSFPFHRQ